jgi:hypothetical protein
MLSFRLPCVAGSGESWDAFILEGALRLVDWQPVCHFVILAYHL